jgi:hypothetical protein
MKKTRIAIYHSCWKDESLEFTKDILNKLRGKAVAEGYEIAGFYIDYDPGFMFKKEIEEFVKMIDIPRENSSGQSI